MFRPVGVSVRMAMVVLTELLVSPAAWTAPSPPPTVVAAPSSFQGRAAPTAFAPFLSADTDLVLLPGARRPAARPVVVAATRVAARANDVATVFLTPALLRQALPALVRAEVIATRPGPRPEGWPDRLLAWEVEVPLFNLKGKAWLQQRPDGAELTLVEGDFVPGNIRFRVAAAADDSAAAVLTTELQVEVRSSNWIFRKVARHDPWAETAMTAAMGWVVTRAVALRAEAPPGARPARPGMPLQAPAATALDGTAVARPALAGLRGAGLLASVRRASSGRLAWASVVAPLTTSAAAAESLAARLAAPENWVVFPGWKSVKRRPAPAASVGGRSPLLVEVKDDVSLVDLDAVWAVEPGLPVRATVVEGDTRGGVLTWQIFSQGGSSNEVAGAAAAGNATRLAVLSMHPRLDAAGFVERRLVAAEPLLEHALALALTYVNAAAMADDLVAHDPGNAPRHLSP